MLVAEPDEQEMAYYRAVEDLFAALRGVPHTLSPRDFQLLRGWWRDEVPLAAVRAGVAEVIARRRERADDDPVTSLGYCRHAVRAHARRLAAMRVGTATIDAGENAPAAAVAELKRALAAAVAGQRPLRPRAAAVIATVADQLEALGGLPVAELEEQLFTLESALLAACWDALDDGEQRELTGRAAAAVAAVAADGATESALLAHRDRELRLLLGLPRLELP